MQTMFAAHPVLTAILFLPLPAGLLLACFSFLLLTITLSMEFTRYVPSRRWLLRFPIVLVCASELVKLRFVLLLADQADSTYFFYMYLVYVAAQVGGYAVHTY